MRQVAASQQCTHMPL